MVTFKLMIFAMHRVLHSIVLVASLYLRLSHPHRHLTKDSPGRIGGLCGLCGSAVSLGVKIRFVRAEGLEKQDNDAGGVCPLPKAPAVVVIVSFM